MVLNIPYFWQAVSHLSTGSLHPWVANFGVVSLLAELFSILAVLQSEMQQPKRLIISHTVSVCSTQILCT